MYYMHNNIHIFFMVHHMMSCIVSEALCKMVLVRSINFDHGNIFRIHDMMYIIYEALCKIKFILRKMVFILHSAILRKFYDTWHMSYIVHGVLRTMAVNTALLQSRMILVHCSLPCAGPWRFN